MSTVLLAASLAAFVSSSALMAASLRPRGVVAFVLATFLIAYAGVVSMIAALSPFHLVLRSWVVGGSIAVAFAGVCIWVGAGRPRKPSFRAALSSLSRELRDPPVAIFAGVVALALVYLAALAFGTPANSWDAMWYHLARAAFWKQHHGIGYVPNANDARLNASPPVAEIGDLYTMVVGSTDRFVGGVALASYCAAMLAVFGIGRRLLLDRRAAIFSALVFASLPVIVMQASGALNDLVLTAFLSIAVYFLLGTRRTELALGGLAVAMATGTKVSAVLVLPFVVMAAALAPRQKWRWALPFSVGAGLVIGCGWYFVNAVETGAWDGGLASHAGVDLGGAAGRGAVRSIAIGSRLLLDFVEVPGGTGWWGALYVVGGLAVAAFLWFEAARAWRVGSRALIAGSIAVSPLVILVLGPVLKRGYQWVFFHVGHSELGILDQDRGFVGASALASFYGPLGLLLLAAVVAIPLRYRRSGLRSVAILFASAPLLFAAVLAIAIGYDSNLGRFFMFPMALAAASAGVLARRREIAWGVVAVAAVTMILTLRANDEKPPSVWGKPRWWVQTKVGGRDNGELRVIRFAEESIPERDGVGLAIRSVDWSYPFFGGELERTVRFTPAAGSGDRALGWLVVAPTKEKPGAQWTRVLATHDGWAVFKRVSH